MLSDAEIVRRLRLIRYSPQRERYARRAPSINGIATAAGISRELVHRIAMGEPIGRFAKPKLSQALTCEEKDGARRQFPPK